MKMFILWFFAVLGFIFCLIIFAVLYLVIADPFNLRPLVSMMWQDRPVTEQSSSNTEVPSGQTEPVVDFTSPDGDAPETGGPNAAQSAALDSVGLGADVAAQITPEQEACFVEVLGQARVDAVKAGAVPTASEFFAARGCI
jgi:hypothetical protein